MTTITVDIINDKAIKLLQDMELLQLIRLHTETADHIVPENKLSKYKGVMTKQPLDEVDAQLKDLRNGWE